MTKSSLSLSALATAILVAAIATSTTAQAPQQPAAPAVGQQNSAAGSPPPPRHSFPAPTNLKVLPKNLTGEQVREIMEHWESSLGGNCGTCHTADPTHKAPNGRPMLNFADDTKKEKQVARLMFKMTEDINANYVADIQENSGIGVTCGTCHRGHLTPEPFVAPPEHHGPGAEHHDDHDQHPAPPVSK